ncbi:unnamed protein product [Prorocentrum cordatum]|uniref:Uncharacterized protein n=1 Tax=Prorocentrum cordatum TaxID=2364126 RepID=A0ABN9V3Y1_9DINO|nr:unnamed protein product [Polarella glacialis]
MCEIRIVALRAWRFFGAGARRARLRSTLESVLGLERLPALLGRVERLEARVADAEARTAAALEGLRRDVGALRAPARVGAAPAEAAAAERDAAGAGGRAEAGGAGVLEPSEVLAALARHGVRDIYADVFGDWGGSWSPWEERGWMYEDGYHFNLQGQASVRRHFQKWLREEEERAGRFDVLVSDSVFLTHDPSCPSGRVEQDKAEMMEMGFSSVHMRCGVGFVRNRGFAQMIEEALRSGELVIARGARVLLITSGNDLWCCPYTQPLYSEGWLAAHIRWVRDVLEPVTPHVVMASLIRQTQGLAG